MSATTNMITGLLAALEAHVEGQNITNHQGNVNWKCLEQLPFITAKALPRTPLLDHSPQRQTVLSLSEMKGPFGSERRESPLSNFYSATQNGGAGLCCSKLQSFPNPTLAVCQQLSPAAYVQLGGRWGTRGDELDQGYGSLCALEQSDRDADSGRAHTC